MNSGWAAMLGFAVLRLGLSPSGFWALGFREFHALAQACAPPQTPNRAALEALMLTHPDAR
jgi:uncharacterized phage protein (TIGR02216 family)